MNGRDLGTYHLRVELADGRGWIDTWNTGARYTNGSAEHSPLSAYRIKPLYDTEADLFDNMRFMYTDGNWSCDCNKTLFWCRSQQLSEPDESVCGDTMVLAKLTVIRPDGTEHALWP
jgi:hypothetical protein